MIAGISLLLTIYWYTTVIDDVEKGNTGWAIFHLILLAGSAYLFTQEVMY